MTRKGGGAPVVLIPLKLSNSCLTILYHYLQFTLFTTGLINNNDPNCVLLPIDIPIATSEANSSAIGRLGSPRQCVLDIDQSRGGDGNNAPQNNLDKVWQDRVSSFEACL